MDFIPLTRTTGAAVVAQTLMKSLENFNLPLTNIRGQGYDGASAVSSDKVGVQASINKESPSAVHTHCSSHSLN